jgi:large subunit ribosomal protein L9
MKVILLKKVPKVGEKYDVKNVADGHALNFLIPNKLAIVASASEMKRVEILKTQEESTSKIKADLLAKNLASVEQIAVTIKAKANDKGHLFKAIHNDEIASAVKEQSRVEIDPAFIHTEKAVKEVGEHVIEVKVGDASARFKLEVVAE